MKITQEHALFYASRKSKLFVSKTCIHTLINSQVKIVNREKITAKHNDLNLLKMVYNRCKRNNLDLRVELFKILSSTSEPNRKRLFGRVWRKLKVNK
jgi:LPS O-antigen subunit length determinant protein (WzzB/FepE family)